VRGLPRGPHRPVEEHPEIWCGWLLRPVLSWWLAPEHCGSLERLARSLGMVLVGAICAVGGSALALELHSSAFASGGEIPIKHTCDGPDRSPTLRWTDPSANAESFALIVDRRNGGALQAEVSREAPTA
jgi:hypothetical protein